MNDNFPIFGTALKIQQNADAEKEHDEVVNYVIKSKVNIPIIFL